MYAVSTNQIADILHFNDNNIDIFIRMHIYICMHIYIIYISVAAALFSYISVKTTGFPPVAFSTVKKKIRVSVR